MFEKIPATEENRKRRKPVRGVGINDVDYQVSYTRDDGSRAKCPYYTVWVWMLDRCYNPKRHKRQPCYIGCTVCPSWLRFSNFRAWMKTQDWKDKAIDKDILVPGNKEYRPDACIFVTQAINCLLTLSEKTRGAQPLGVTKGKSKKNPYIAYCCKYAKQVRLGSFPTAQAAHNAYLHAKAEHIIDLAVAQSNPKLRLALLLRARDFAKKII